MTFLLLQPTHRMLLRHDERIGHRFVPNLRARVPNELGGYFLRTNAQGFRSDVDFEPARGERPRIVWLGDSYLAGDNLANEERFSDLCGARLDAEVYNYGLPGSGLDQQLLVYEHCAADVEADLVVVAPSVDTVDRIQTSHRESIDRTTRRRVLVPKPYFRLEDGALRLHQEVVPRERPEVDALASGELPDVRAGELRGAGALLEWYRTSPATRALRQRATEPQAMLQSFLYRAARVQPYDDYRSAGSPGWRLLAALLERLVEQVAPTPVLIVPIPANPFLTHRAAPIYQPLFEALAAPERGVHVLDLTTPMTRGGWRERRSLSFRYDAHFSPQGHALAARVIADEIERVALLPVREAPAAPAPAPAPRRAAPKPRRVLGISCFYHDSAAALVEDGRIVAAAAEERFSRVKNDRRFPHSAANYVLEQGGAHPDDLDAVVYYDNASLTFERLLQAQAVAGEAGREVWLRMLPSWVRFKLHLPQLVRKSLAYDGLLLQEVHHRSHAASAFYPSPFESAAILTVDGVGEWATASIGRGRGRTLELLKEMRFPNSLGLLYSAFTQFTGFKVNSGEYKMMGLAPYGRPLYAQRMLDELVDLKDDGSIELRMEYFDFLTRMSMTNDAFADLFDGPARAPDDRIGQREMDIARSIQVVVEQALMRMARFAKSLTGESRLCLAGGVAFNCVANGVLLREGPFDDLWIQPAAGDAGCAVGAALDAHHTWFEGERAPVERERPLQGGSYLGPDFSSDEIRGFLETGGYAYHELAPEERAERLAALLEDGKVLGHFSGRMEFGPRALGARSILGDARNTEMQATLNLKIKYRESFRPFAPSVLREKVSDYFELDGPSPYMQLVTKVNEDRRLPFDQAGRDDLLEVVREARSDIPAITHVDYSARVQTVQRCDHPAYYDLIRAFGEKTGVSVVVNTSFNVRGEPIVCTPDDAYRCFMGTEMDALVLGDFLLLKAEQPAWSGPSGHVEEEDEARAIDRSDPLVERLDAFFESEFLPVVRRLAASGDLAFGLARRDAGTTWSDVRRPRSPRDLFEIPPELDTPKPDPERVAAAICRAWAPGTATMRLRPLVARLLALGRRFPLEESLAGEVEDSVYVMF